jgi:hypothetical protein
VKISKEQQAFINKRVKEANKKYRDTESKTGFTEEVNDKIATMLMEVTNDLYEMWHKKYVLDIVEICGEGVMELNPKVMVLHCLVNAFETIQQDYLDRIYQGDKTLNILASDASLTQMENIMNKAFIRKEMIYYLTGQDTDMSFLKYFVLGDKRKLN